MHQLSLNIEKLESYFYRIVTVITLLQLIKFDPLGICICQVDSFVIYSNLLWIEYLLYVKDCCFEDVKCFRCVLVVILISVYKRVRFPDFRRNSEQLKFTLLDGLRIN
jgi:hypothetical protein